MAMCPVTTRAASPDNSFAGWRSRVTRQAHNLKVLGSNPNPATNFQPSDKSPAADAL